MLFVVLEINMESHLDILDKPSMKTHTRALTAPVNLGHKHVACDCLQAFGMLAIMASLIMGGGGGGVGRWP